MNKNKLPIVGSTRNCMAITHSRVGSEVTMLVAFAYTPQVYFFIRFREYWVISDLGILTSRNKSLHPWHSYRDSSKSLLQKAVKVRCSLLHTLLCHFGRIQLEWTYAWTLREMSEDYIERYKIKQHLCSYQNSAHVNISMTSVSS